jgi:ubiquinone/menaquinone biosynthesis C-methylase UbiE
MSGESLSETSRAIAQVFGRAAASYGRAGPDFFAPAGRRLVELADLRPGERVLDVGAGTGVCTVPAAEAVGAMGSVRAVDLAPEMVERLRRELAARRLDHVDVAVADAADPPPGDAHYDAVLAGFLLFFLPDVASAVRRYAALLRPEGRLVASWFGADDERWKPVFAAVLAHLPAGTAPPKPPSGEVFSSIDSVETMLRSAGFTDVSTLEEPHVLHFVDAEQWYQWSRSHGMRALWEQVGADRLDAARGAAFHALSSIDDGEGLTLQFRLRYTRAQLAAQ